MSEQSGVIFNGACVCLVNVSKRGEQVSGSRSPPLMHGRVVVVGGRPLDFPRPHSIFDIANEITPTQSMCTILSQYLCTIVLKVSCPQGVDL